MGRDKRTMLRSLTALLVLACIASAQYVGQGADGNPHNWDRSRRCDHTDYSPKCGPCEGYGGIPTGDENSAITLTTCSIVSNASAVDPKTLIHPVWSDKWQANNYQEIIIGLHRDPFCFQVFPGNTSAGKLCYRHDSGTQSYDMSGGESGPHTLYEDLILDTKVGKIPLDHWSFGPHHVWSIPGTGEVRRFWQPFNGLQVFQDGTQNVKGLDPKVFEDIPPALCKKGGALFRIKCTDDGYPQNKKTMEVTKQHLKDMPKDTSSKEDILRARQVVPGASYKGASFQNMSLTLNKYLSASAAVKPCDDFSAKEIQELQAMLYLARDAKLDSVYQDVTDNRKLNGELKDLQRDWAGLNQELQGHENKTELHAIQRDGHCHEAVMWYVHHLSTDVKMVLAQTGVEIPLLSYDSHDAKCDSAQERTHKKVCKGYQEVVLCTSCHSNALPSR